MLLLPTEYWEYGLVDAIGGLIDAMSGRKPDPEILIPGLGLCLPVRSARSAIVAAILALDLPHDARIGVPLYCCPAVFKAIAASGRTPRFIDVDPETYCISVKDVRAKRSQIDAVITVHMFGNLCDMQGLGEATEGKPIIEDCAQSLGSRLAGRPAGSFGTVSAFSFRSGKYLSVGEGGALYTAHPEIHARVSGMIASLPVPGRGEECRHVALTWVRSMLRRKPLYGMLGRQVWMLYNKTVDFSAKTSIVYGRIYATDFLKTRSRIANLDAVIAERRANAEFYSRTLQVAPWMLCAERSGTFSNRYLYPIMFPSRAIRDSVAASLRRRGIDSAKPYHDIAEVARKYYGYTGDCPAAEQVADKVLVIPSYNGLKRKDLERVAKCFNEGWAEITGRGAGAFTKECMSM